MDPALQLGPGTRNGGLLEHARFALIVLITGLAGCGDGPGGGGKNARAPRPAYPIPGERGEAVLAEVLNATTRPGLARSGVRVLRRAGIDVVYWGNATGEEGATAHGEGGADSTLIVLRRGGRKGAERVRRALGVGTIVVARDTARLLDVTVLLGADFRPRLEFHP